MKYGFIGLGNMGHFMASHCVDAGYEMILTSHTAYQKELKQMVSRGAVQAESNAEIAKNAQRVFLCLPNGSVVKEVVKELIDTPQSVVKEIYDFSTIGPNESKELGEEGKKKGYTFFDCPIAGGVTGAEAGTLSIMVGCEEEEFERVKAVLYPMGKNIMRAGKTGSGSAVKILNNYLGGASLVACCEVMVMAKQLGLDIEKVFSIINKSTGRNFATENIISGFLKNRDFQPGFATDLFYKDINLALQTAEELKLPLSIGPAVLYTFGITRAMGFGKEHSIAAVKYYEAMANVKINEEKKDNEKEQGEKIWQK